MTTVSAVLVIDVSDAVDDLSILLIGEAVRLLPCIPAGVPIRLDVGRAVALDGGIGLLGEALRRAGSVEVVGNDPTGVAEVRQRLSRAFATTGAVR